MNENIYGMRLREARKRAGISQIKLGIMAGFDEFSASARLSQYETGKHLPDMQTAIRISEVLETPLAYFFCKENELAEQILTLESLTLEQRTALIDFIKLMQNK